MRLPTAALVAGFVATSAAFLLPPNLEEIREGINEEIKDARFRGPPKYVKDLMHSLLQEKTTTVDLECPGCPYAAARSEERNSDSSFGAIVWEQDVDNLIHLEFDTHNNGLNVNGLPLLPLERAGRFPPTVLKAYQMKKDADSSEHSADVDLSFVVGILPPMPSPHHDGVSMIPVEITILKINDIPVKVNTIVLKVIRTPDDSYVIVHTEQTPFKNTPGAKTCEGARPWAICRIKAIIADKMKEAIEAAKEKASKVHGWVKDKTPGCGKGRAFGKHPRPHSDYPSGEHPHPHPHHWGKHHGHHHHRFHRLSHMIRQTLRFFVVPALLGIIGGLAASAIGMLVGQAIIYLWFRTYRNGQRGPLRIYEQEIVLIDEEQNGLLAENDEALPKYEDAPKYEETMSRDVEANPGARDSENEKQ